MNQIFRELNYKQNFTVSKELLINFINAYQYRTFCEEISMVENEFKCKKY